jgi:tetratricopeptide (TPR) repeat protein
MKTEAKPHLERGLMLSGDPRTVEDAAASFRKAIELDPEDPLPHFYLGTMYYRWSHYWAAVEPLERAIELKPDEFAIYMNLGMNYNLLGNESEAERYLQKAVKLQPEDAEAHYQLGFSLLQQYSRSQEAVEHFRLAFKYNSKHGMALHFLSLALVKTKDYDGARQLREEIRETHPKATEYLDLILQLNDPE